VFLCFMNLILGNRCGPRVNRPQIIVTDTRKSLTFDDGCAQRFFEKRMRYRAARLPEYRAKGPGNPPHLSFFLSLVLKTQTYVLCVLLDSRQCLSRISRGWSSKGFAFGHSHKLPGITTGVALGGTSHELGPPKLEARVVDAG